MKEKLLLLALSFLVITAFAHADVSGIGVSAQVGNATVTPTYRNINVGESLGSSLLIAMKGSVQFVAVVTDSMMSSSAGFTDLIVLLVIIGIVFIGCIVMVANGIQNAKKLGKK